MNPTSLPFEYPFQWDNESLREGAGVSAEAAAILKQRDRDLEDFLATLGKIPFLVAASGAPDEIKAVSNYVCDGVDDQVEINAAIADSQMSGAGYEVVQLSIGTFDISAPIGYLHALHGTHGGAGSSLGASPTLLIVRSPMSGPVIAADDLRDVHVRVDATVTGMVVDGYDVIEHVTLSRSGSVNYDVGIAVYRGARISDCHVRHSYGGVAFDVQTSDRVTFTGVVIEQGAGGIITHGSPSLAVTGCIFSSLTGTAIDSDVHSPKMAVAGCLFETVGIGIDKNGTAASLNTGARDANTFVSVTTPIL